MIVIYNNHFIAGICQTQETLDKWKSVNPIPEDLTVKTMNLVYPFYVMELTTLPSLVRDYSFLQTREEVNDFKKNNKDWTCYTFNKDWLGTPKFEDYMGVLNHEHAPEENVKKSSTLKGSLSSNKSK